MIQSRPVRRGIYRKPHCVSKGIGHAIRFRRTIGSYFGENSAFQKADKRFLFFGNRVRGKYTKTAQRRLFCPTAFQLFQRAPTRTVAHNADKLCVFIAGISPFQFGGDSPRIFFSDFLFRFPAKIFIGFGKPFQPNGRERFRPFPRTGRRND